MKLYTLLCRATLYVCLLFTVEYAAARHGDGTAPAEECTVGVASGRATSDGRPLLWKTRDANAPSNEVVYNDSNKIAFIAVVTAGSSVAWMGVNERGFAIMNSQSSDLKAAESGLDNGTFMTLALGTCATVAEFERLLDSTNVTGRTTTANLGVIDASGAAAIFETDGDEYWKFDARDPLVAPHGYVLRSNFTFNGGGKGGIERYHRTVKLVAEYYAGDSLNYRSIIRHQMRDFVDSTNVGIDVPFATRWKDETPYGYIDCNKSICRPSSVSAAVFHGVLPHEPAILTTMWAILGQPASGVAVPYWPVGAPPREADGEVTAPLCDVANEIRTLLFDYPDDRFYIDTAKLRSDSGNGLWTITFAAEDHIFSATASVLEKWRRKMPAADKMIKAETKFARFALKRLRRAHSELLKQ